MLELIFSSFLLLTIILCFFRIELGVALFLGYCILVPYLKFFFFGENIFAVLLLLALLYNYGVKNFVWKPLIPFLFLYSLQFLIIPFHNDVPFGIQVNAFRVDVMQFLLLPFVMINLMHKNPKAIGLLFNVLIFSTLISALYTLFLTSMPGINPYLMSILPLSGGNFQDTYALAEGEGRLFGRISGVFTHPMTNGLFLSLALVFLLTNLDFRNLLKHKRTLFIIAIVILAIVSMGVRTAIVAAVIGVLLFIAFYGKIKIAFYVSFGLLLVFWVLFQIPGIDNYILSIIDSDSSNIKGSSIEMRLDQLDGCFKEIKNNPLFGKGYSWTGYYKSLKGDHPIMLSFESLIFVVLCNNGFVGLIIWLGMILLYVRYVLKNFISVYYIGLLVLLATYLAYSVITGDYGYMRYFLVFYSVLWMDANLKQHKAITNILLIHKNETT